ncbi:MAG: site-specific integrase [Ignavibacteriae bacterium]|nr:site-specific integrase [Ignavibacteriota bacterium]
MKISILKKKISNNKTSLYLVFYNGYFKDNAGKLKLNRKYENLDIQIHTEPKNAEQRQENKDKMSLVENVIKKREIELISGKFEFNSLIEKKITLFEFLNEEIHKLTLKKNSYQNYDSFFKHLFEYCNPDTTLLKNIDENFINGFKEHLNNINNQFNKPLHTNTKLVYLSKFKTLLSKAFKRGLIPKNPFNLIKNYRKIKTSMIYLTLDEINQLDKAKCKSELIKNAFLFSCFTTLRVSDLRNLKWKQIVKENGVLKVHIRQQKTDELLYLPIQKQAIKYLGERGNPEDFVFKGLINNSYTNQALYSWAYETGIKKKITFHKARHTGATILLNSGVDLYTVSKILGHKTIESTQIYAKVVDKSIQEAFNKFPKIKK